MLSLKNFKLNFWWYILIRLEYMGMELSVIFYQVLAEWSLNQTNVAKRNHRDQQHMLSSDKYIQCQTS